MSPYGLEIVEMPELKLVFIFNISNAMSYRRIYMDGRSHPKDVAPTYLGHSTGRWEGDSLVAVTTRGVVRVRERSTRSATLRSAALALTRDVQGLATRELRVVGDTLRYRARRGEGVACAIDGTGVALTRASWGR